MNNGAQPFELIRTAILEGDAEKASKLSRDCLLSGMPPLDAMNSFITPLKEVGRLWEDGELFLPELVASAEAVLRAINIIKPEIIRQKIAYKNKTAIIGTVHGDIHDIGKSLVGTMLLARGFDVIDLGTDVPPTAFADAAEKHNASLVGISALLTTTMLAQRNVINELSSRGIRKNLTILIGGAPVTREWAQEIGADGTAPDAISAAELACQLVEHR